MNTNSINTVLVAALIISSSTVLFNTVMAQNYFDVHIARKQIAEGLSMASSYKNQLTQYYRKTHNYSGAKILEFKGKKSGKYVDSISLELATGKTVVIVTKFKNTGVNPYIAGQDFLLATDNGGITWQCGYKIKEPKIDSKLQIKPIFLPLACR